MNLENCPFHDTDPNICGCYEQVGDLDTWQTRPIEDRIKMELSQARKRIAELEASEMWIPVWEMMPEELTDVMVVSKVLDSPQYIGIGCTHEGKWLAMNSQAVTHWRRLPVGPGEVGE